MNFILYGIWIAWIVRICGNIISYAQLWRVKEYRFDRMLIHLRTPQGKRIFFPTWKRPGTSPKTIFFVIGMISMFVFIYVQAPISIGVRLLILDVCSFPATWFIVGFMQIPTILYHRYVIQKALKKLRTHAQMVVVGVTGSFGKTSVKEYLFTILSTKYRVLKTEKSKNSSIGIAEVIWRSLRPEHEIFIVEMGAYKRGEIAEMTDMVKPEIGILTAINPQHQDLFGSLDTTMKAKYELLAGLSEKKIAIINYDNERTRQMIEWAKQDKCQVWIWSKDAESPKLDNGFYAQDIKVEAKSISFMCVHNNESVKIHASVLGEHQVGNILAAVAGAVACGMEFRSAARAASTVTAIEKVMEPHLGIHGSTFINDAFNNNPDAAKAAIAYMGSFTGKKILVFQPMIELGEFAEPSHTDVGAYAAKHVDAIILTNDNFFHDFERGVRSVSQTIPLLVMSPKNAAAYIQSHVSNGDIVLFKGKESERVLEALR